MVKAIVGVNWGDEGKGKITDMLAQDADVIVRFQGGSNAGHTIKNEYGKFPLHMLPSGVFYSHTTCVLGNGVALNIPKLIEEIDSIVEKAYRSRIFSFLTEHTSSCHIISCWTDMRKNASPAKHTVPQNQVSRLATQTNTPKSASR